MISIAVFQETLKKRMKELAEHTLSRCLPIPDRYVLGKLEESFTKWMSGFSKRSKDLLSQHIRSILEAIRFNRIPGFTSTGDSVWFDEVGTFGFSFVQESAIVDHILKSLGIELPATNVITLPNSKVEQVNADTSEEVEDTLPMGQIDIFAWADNLKIVEITEKKKGGKKAPVVGQLALDLF